MSYSVAILLILSLIVIGVVIYKATRPRKWTDPEGELPPKWREILNDHVPFYRLLDNDQKTLFEFKVNQFLTNCKITGIQVKVDDLDKILVASSAVIPIFNFPEWEYINIDEVLIYPNEFNIDFEVSGEDRSILGMVGSGIMEGKMILSKKSLHLGFQNETDKKNTAIHEFVHLIDKSDGVIDGVPKLLLERQYLIPWVNLMRQKIELINKSRKTDINRYGTTNNAEFFAVISEYFFERPKLLKRKHPKLYEQLNQIFSGESV
ncbi:MAG: M90 family metallopeptidase [Bacteroidota bacterium]